MRRISTLFCTALVLAGAATAQAGVAYRGTRGLIKSRSADTIGRGLFNVQLSEQYYTPDSDVLTAGVFPFGDAITADATARYHFFITRATLTYGLNNFLEIAANLEVRNWIRNPEDKNGHSLDLLTRGGIGDGQVTAKLGGPVGLRNLRLGALGEAGFPTGDEERHFSTDEPEFTLLGLATLDLTDMERFVPTRVHVNVGWQFNKNEEFGFGIFNPNFPDSSGFLPPGYPALPTDATGEPTESNSYNDQLLLNAAIEFPAPQVTFFVEFDVKSFINIDDDALKTPTIEYSKYLVHVTPGFEVPIGDGYRAKLAAELNLNSGDTPALSDPPDWQAWLMISRTFSVVPMDSDNDGVPDTEDQCPNEAEDLDGFQDQDGCPEFDNDGDGIPDKDDKCPDLAEDLDGFEDQDGCPDLDNDQDGIPDKVDRCPNEPEDFDGDEDQDGCPDLVKDSDGDGIPDDLDRCPLQPEDLDGFQDDDGCPDLDNDLDGIPDADDQCPNAPETFNGIDDEDGCPDEKPIEQQFVLKGVTFESGSAALTPESYRVLDEVVRSLMAYPEVRVEIRGYTDSVGNSSNNLKLSQRRADAVKQYLVNAGVGRSRMESHGFGEESPISSNSTPTGRKENRRIEFQRLN